MQAELFNYMKGGIALNKLDILEDNISKVIDKISILTDKNKSLNNKITDLQGNLKKKDEELKLIRKEMKSVDLLKTDINKLNYERETVRSQVENLLRELESVEL
jgi:chromosome segregation ATPase